MAVKITELAMQVGLDEAVTDTATGWFWLTVIVTGFDITWVIEMHGEFEVISHVMTSPLAGGYVYETLFVPVLIPLTFH